MSTALGPLRSYSDMFEEETARATMHREIGRKTKDVDTRVWRFLLATQAEARAARWFTLRGI